MSWLGVDMPKYAIPDRILGNAAIQTHPPPPQFQGIEGHDGVVLVTPPPPSLNSKEIEGFGEFPPPFNWHI